MASGTSPSSAGYPPKPGDQVHDHNGKNYRILQPLGKPGAYGYTFLVQAAGAPGDSQQFVIKIPKLDPNTYGTEETSQRDRDISDSFKSEITTLERLAGLKGVAALRGIGVTRVDLAGIGYLNFLVYDYVPGPNLQDWLCSEHTERGFEAFSWFRLARSLVERLDAIHQERVVHGDIWPNNIIMRQTTASKGDWDPVFIDFGKAWVLDQHFDRSAEQNAWHPYWAPERFRVLKRFRSGGKKQKEARVTRWFAPADWYSLGITLLKAAAGPSLPDAELPCPFLDRAMATNSSQPGPEGCQWLHASSSEFKRTSAIRDCVVSILRKYNPGIYKQNIGIVDIVLSCIRPAVENRIHHAYELRQLLDCFDHSASPAVSIATVDETEKAIAQRVRKFSAAHNPLFLAIFNNNLKTVEAQLPNPSSRVFAQFGGRESLISAFITLLSQVRKGDKLLGLTSSTFWRDENMGSNGRALTMLRMAAEREASIMWLTCYSTSQGRSKASQVSKILGAHERLMADYYAARPNAKIAKFRPSESAPPQGLFLGHLRLKPQELDKIIDNRLTGILIRSEGKSMLVAPDYSERGGRLIVLRFWANPERYSTIETNFWRQMERCTAAFAPPRA